MEKPANSPVNPYSFSRRAQSDLREIWQWIDRRSAGAAKRMEADLREACEFIAANPGVGYRRTDITAEDLQFWLVRRTYLIIYKITNERVIIYRILHGARDLASELE